MRYHLEWKWIPDEANECPLNEKDYETFAEAWGGFSVVFEDDCMFAILRDRESGDKWEFESGWLDHFPKAKREGSK